MLQGKEMRGHCSSDCYIFNSGQELEDFANNIPNLRNKSVTIVAQTTFNVARVGKLFENNKKRYIQMQQFLIQYVMRL